jgi:hypothetical protein
MYKEAVIITIHKKKGDVISSVLLMEYMRLSSDIEKENLQTKR